MSDQQPPVEDQINGGGGVSVAGPPVALQPDAAVAVAPLKRQRRPSVRLGDIGDQHTYDNNRRTKPHQWKFPSKDVKSSKTRPLVNLTASEFQDVNNGSINNNNTNHNNNNNNGSNGNDNNDNNNNKGMIGSWKARDSSKSKRGFSGAKRVRSNWGSKMDQGDDFDHDDNDDDDDESLNFSMDNEMDLNYGKETGTRVRVSDGVELDGPSDTDARNWNNNQPERNGVRVWLNQLGLGRYAPVFEVHEVDDEVLPLLTLEDLKDMGINAVGSRRKMFCSIQKLGKGFS